MKSIQNRHHLPLWTICALLVLGSASAQHAEKVPCPPPFLEDIKTPAPAPSAGTSLRASIPARGGSAPRASETQPAKLRPEPASLAPASRARPERVQVRDTGDGAIWARGSNYKARFATDGVTFVPFFGSKAETNHPVRFELASVRVGAHALPIDRTIEPRLSGEVVDFQRGAVVERWQVRFGSVEQQFLIDALAPSGDLLLEIAVETDLSAEIADGGLAFGCALGHVDYGAAVAIDADGRRFALETTWNGTTIGLRLDHAALASARFPLLVDPVISTTSFDTSAIDSFAPDVAYDVASNSYLLVNEEAYSATDHDVYAVHFDGSGIGLVLFTGYLDYSTDDWRRPKVASNALAHNFLCVAAVTPVAGGLRRIRGITFTAWTYALGAQFTISGNEGGDKLYADVGGDSSTTGPTYYLVSWQRTVSAADKDIHARLVQPSGTTVGGLILVDNSSNTIDTVPAISKSNGRPPYNTQVWTIVWQRFYFGTQEQVLGAQYHWDGVLYNPTYFIDSGDPCRAPSVSSPLDGDAFYPRTYMVAFQVQSQLQTQWDILGTIFEGTSFRTGTDIGDSIDDATNTSEQINPRVDCDGWHFAVTWAQEYAGGNNDWDIFVADLVYGAGYPYVTSWDTFAYSTLQELNPAITSTYSGGGARKRYCAAWDVLDQFTPAAVRDVWNGYFDGGEGGFASAYCFGDGSETACPCTNTGAAGNGCANFQNTAGANLAWAGNPWVGNDSLVLLGSGMPNSAVLYFQGTTPDGYWTGVTFGNGLRCVGGSIVRLGVKFNANGASQYPAAGDPTIASFLIMPSFGAQFFYQAWYRDDLAFCTGAGFNLTNGVRAVYAP